MKEDTPRSEVAVSLFARISERWRPGKVALSSSTGSIRYEDLQNRVQRAASWIRGQGIQPGEVLALHLPRSVRFVELHLAALAMGVVTLPLNPAYPAEEVLYYLRDSGARLLLTASELADAPCRVVLFGTAFEQVLDQEDAVELPEPPGEDTLALLLYTSGTTGRPKGAMLEHRHVRATIDALDEAWEWRDTDVLVHALPLFHVHGLIVAALGALRAGAEICWVERFDPAAVLDVLANRGTVFMAVPTFYRRFLDLPADSAWDLSGVRLWTSGSAPLPARDHEAFRARFGASIVERYGMTEVGIVLSNPLHGPHRAGTVGLPLPRCQIAIVSPDTGEAVGQGEVGEIAIAGPSVFRGYLGQTTEMRDGWLRSGDLAIRDPDGWVTVVGRRKEMVLSGGLNVYPAEVERALLDDPALAEAAVVGVPDPDLGERVVAVVVPRSGQLWDTVAGLAALRTRLAPYKCPKWAQVRESLPRNAMGKVVRAELARDLARAAVRPARIGDAGRIVAWNLAMARETEGLALDPATVQRGVETVFQRETGAKYYVAEVAGEVVGQCMVTTEWSDWRNTFVWWFQSVYVPRPWRHRGVFRTLYRAVREEALANGAAGLRLYVDKGNTNAQGVYGALGMNGDHYQVFEAMFSKDVV